MALRPHVSPELLHKVTKALRITALEQWYYVSHTAIAQAIGNSGCASGYSLKDFGGSVGFLKSAYPEHSFDEEKLKSKMNIEKDQKFLEVILRKLFPNTEMHTKAKKAVGIVNPETNSYLEIDFWFPNLKLGIEYQDKHHYTYQWYANEPLEDYKKRDRIKKDAMSNLGYTLVTVGFWWDKTIESVAATIRKVRPDLLREFAKSYAEPIPLEPPPGFLSESSCIPGVSGLMNPFIPRAGFNPTNWYAGEKYDGIRGVYNPELTKVFSRSGKELSVHSSLLSNIPRMLVEGEIAVGRGNYNKTAVVSTQTHHDKVNWSMYRYVLYDIPNAELGPYTQRYSAIINGLSVHPYVFAQSVFRVLILNEEHLKMLVDAIIGDAGEGVIAQKDMQYEYGRASGLAKIKVRRDDDALVLGVNELSCTCKLVSGITADINFCNDIDPHKVRAGDVISFYYSGYAKTGLPKQAEIYKVRYDLTWDKIMSDEEAETVRRKSVTDAIGTRSLLAANTIKFKMGHWNNPPNVRAFFDEFARTYRFDPLVPENWYAIRTKNIQKFKGHGLFSAYNFNLMKALSVAYPEVMFEKEKFRTHAQKGHWNSTPNLRAFFDELARSSRFDPLVPDNWYWMKYNSLRNAKGRGILNHYSVAKALKSAYPELKFQEEKFRTHERTKALNNNFLQFFLTQVDLCKSPLHLKRTNTKQ